MAEDRLPGGGRATLSLTIPEASAYDLLRRVDVYAVLVEGDIPTSGDASRLFRKILTRADDSDKMLRFPTRSCNAQTHEGSVARLPSLLR